MDIKRLKGFRDILPEESPLWHRIEVTAREVCRRYGFAEIRLPLLEETTLFARSIGETTDIVEKEMYTFSDPGGTSVTLRPEGTASAVRAYLENGFQRLDPKSRLFYCGPMFRRERPQKGRLRQFHQIGAESFGWAEAGADAEILCLLWDLFAALGLSDRVSLELNSLGCPEDRKRYIAKLRDHLTPRSASLCENCRRRLDANPLRVLDCKSEHCREVTSDVPALERDLCGECGRHFNDVLRQLKRQRIPCTLNPRMVRGLDYYNRTTFELLSTGLGAQNAVAAGGRYDGLVQSLGGPPVPALGFAVGIERVAILLESEEASCEAPVAYLVHSGSGALEEALWVRRGLATAGVYSDIDYELRSIKAQMRSANRRGARCVIIIGGEELAAGVVGLKDLAGGDQETVKRDEIIGRVLQIASEQEKGG